MSNRSEIQLVLDGKTPNKTPLTVYAFMLGDLKRDAVRKVVEKGLGLCIHCCPISYYENGVKDVHSEVKKNGDTYRIHKKITPIGEIQNVRRNGWHHEDWIKKPSDYKILQWIVEHTEMSPNYEAFHRIESNIGDDGITIATGSRTPAMSINVDWAGTQRFCEDIASNVTELFDVYEAKRKAFIEETKMLSKAPGRYVKWLENLTISMIGKKRYANMLMNVYNEAVPILHEANKRVMVHYDGALKCIADQIAKAPFDMIESLTEPPEGDMTYDECRKMWNDKVFWANINVALYYGDFQTLKEEVKAKRKRAGKKGLAFEVSEDLPANWEKSIPVVLEALQEAD